MTPTTPGAANTHKPECYINQNWDEALQALADTPNEFRDAEYYAAVEDINSKRTQCTCNTQQEKTAMQMLIEAYVPDGNPENWLRKAKELLAIEAIQIRLAFNHGNQNQLTGQKLTSEQYYTQTYGT